MGDGQKSVSRANRDSQNTHFVNRNLAAEYNARDITQKNGIQQMNEDEISAYHEAGHIIVNATIGRRVKCSEIYHRRFTDFFQADEPITLPQNTIAGVVYQLPVKSKEISCEEATLKAHSARSLEEYLITLLAGVEASLIYAEVQSWDTAQISAEIEESEDMKMMQLLIAGRK
ncbi:MAG TPA: hypothetical protein VEP90_00710, partial [Methylomirabilota bacterium]|nr:hypothetical protein [Methylomirabilota bacterium]